MPCSIYKLLSFSHSLSPGVTVRFLSLQMARLVLRLIKIVEQGPVRLTLAEQAT